MRRLTALIIAVVLLAAAFSAAAQDAVNYLIRGIGSQISGGQVVVDFTVLNSGATITVDETAYLFDSSGRRLGSQVIKPLAAGQRSEIAIAVPTSEFTPNSSQTLYVVIGQTELPLNQLDQFSNVTVYIPPQAATDSGSPAAPAGSTNPNVILLPGGYRLDLNDPANLAVLIGGVVVLIVLLWVLSIILRLLFSRPATLSAWQPPYVMTPLLDPNSTDGRRQLWQQHAQSDALPLPCTPGTYMVRKLLIGSDGAKLAGWRVSGLRISQYDRYGRVARSQAVMPKSVVSGLNRAVRRSASLVEQQKAERAVRATARSLTKTIMKKATKQNALLPVALDIRFTGMHGEVRILFELYGCSGSQWQEIDHWEPEMRVANGSIHENFTYTILGQYPEETRKQFASRMEHDLVLLLAAMVQAPPLPPTAEDTSETAAVKA